MKRRYIWKKFINVLPIMSNCFTGHGIGEYAAIFICSNSFTIEKIIDILFMKGSMFNKYFNNIIENDINSYRSVSINPLKLNITGDELEKFISIINKQNNINLEINLYNIKNYQYIVTGKIIDLITFKEFIENKEIRNHNNKKKLKELYKKLEKKNVKELEEYYSYNLPHNIEIPYHTNLLNSDIDEYYKRLYSFLDDIDINYNRFENKYISCLTGSFFTLSIDFLNTVIDITKSSELIDLRDKWATSSNQLKVKKLLATLLSYQTAHSLNWIKVQECIMNHNIEQSFEFGPKNILTEFFIKTAEIYDYKIYSSFVSDKIDLLSETSVYSGINISSTISTKLLSYNIISENIIDDISSDDE